MLNKVISKVVAVGIIGLVGVCGMERIGSSLENLPKELKIKIAEDFSVEDIKTFSEISRACANVRLDIVRNMPYRQGIYVFGWQLILEQSHAKKAYAAMKRRIRDEEACRSYVRRYLGTSESRGMSAEEFLARVRIEHGLDEGQ